MKTYLNIGFSLLAGLSSHLTFAKGLDSLKPSEETTQVENNNAAEDDKALISEMKKVKSEVHEDQTFASNKLSIATSFGWTGISKESKTWSASGMSDITLRYKLPIEFAGISTASTFRYAAADVAPTVENDNIKHDYKGIVEAYHFGALGKFNLIEKLSVIGTAELGFMVVHLDDLSGTANDLAPEDNGVNITLGGGIDWEALPKFILGTRLFLGAGTFSTAQLSFNGSFVF